MTIPNSISLLLFCTLVPVWADTIQADSAQILVSAAIAQIGVTTRYDPSYVAISYPNGDIAPDRGVCTDVIIRALRNLNIDLQELVYKDLKHNFSRYPDNWGLKKPDPSIDHRRVPNLMTYFKRHGKNRALSKNPSAFLPGDIVSWKIPGNLDHIGIVSDKKVKGTRRHYIIHNIGSGVELEDVLFEFTIIGHYRYFK